MSAPTLTVTFGPEAGKVIELAGAAYSIGRDPASQIPLASSDASWKHARLEKSSNEFVLTDAGSANGTFVNGQRLSASQTLKPGDVIRFAAMTEMRFDAPRPARVGETPQPQLSPPPQLIVEESSGEARSITLTELLYTLGRAEDNSIRVNASVVSHYQLRLEKNDAGYQLVPLPDVTNPLLHKGNVLTEPRVLKNGDVVQIGSALPGLMVTLRYTAPASSAKNSK
jgi:pSer/pThr/pTyr-binding forkhead associated (FHA) protein